MRSDDVTMLRIGVGQYVLNEVVAILITRNFYYVQHFEDSGNGDKDRTYYQSKGYVGGLSDLHKHVQGTVQGTQALRS